MFFSSLLQGLNPGSRSRPKVRNKSGPRTCGLAIETLEDRSVPAALISIGDVTIVEGNDGTQTAAIQVTVSRPHGNNVTVNYSTASDSATAGSDFVAVSGKLTFAKNEFTKMIPISIRGDRLAELAESFVVQLSNAKGAQIARSQGTVSIVDNEPRASISSPSVVEGTAGGSVLHFRFDQEGGAKQGKHVGKYILENYLRPVDAFGDVIDGD